MTNPTRAELADIARRWIDEGFLTERWGEWDGIDLLVQLGIAVLPSMTGTSGTT